MILPEIIAFRALNRAEVNRRVEGVVHFIPIFRQPILTRFCRRIFDYIFFSFFEVLILLNYRTVFTVLTGYCLSLSDMSTSNEHQEIGLLVAEIFSRIIMNDFKVFILTKMFSGKF